MVAISGAVEGNGEAPLARDDSRFGSPGTAVSGARPGKRRICSRTSGRGNRAARSSSTCRRVLPRHAPKSSAEFRISSAARARTAHSARRTQVQFPTSHPLKHLRKSPTHAGSPLASRTRSRRWLLSSTHTQDTAAGPSNLVNKTITLSRRAQQGRSEQVMRASRQLSFERRTHWARLTCEPARKLPRRHDRPNIPSAASPESTRPTT